MKKTIGLLICALMLLTIMCITVAADTNIYTYEVDGIEYTVKFEDENIPNEKKAAIAISLISTDETEIMPANILCDIFGHDYLYTTASVIEHKAYANAPRCRQETYDVTYCEDCDYTEQTLVNVTYIDCCPQD